MTPLEIGLAVLLAINVPWGAWLSIKVIRIDAKLANGLCTAISELKKRQDIQSDSVHELRERCARNHQ